MYTPVHNKLLVFNVIDTVYTPLHNKLLTLFTKSQSSHNVTPLSTQRLPHPSTTSLCTCSHVDTSNVLHTTKVCCCLCGLNASPATSYCRCCHSHQVQLRSNAYSQYLLLYSQRVCKYRWISSCRCCWHSHKIRLQKRNAVFHSFNTHCTASTVVASPDTATDIFLTRSHKEVLSSSQLQHPL